MHFSICMFYFKNTEKRYVYSNLNWILYEQYNLICAVYEKLQMVNKSMKSSTSLFLENAN